MSKLWEFPTIQKPQSQVTFSFVWSENTQTDTNIIKAQLITAQEPLSLNENFLAQCHKSSLNPHVIKLPTSQILFIIPLQKSLILSVSLEPTEKQLSHI